MSYFVTCYLRRYDTTNLLINAELRLAWVGICKNKSPLQKFGRPYSPSKVGVKKGIRSFCHIISTPTPVTGGTGGISHNQEKHGRPYDDDGFEDTMPAYYRAGTCEYLDEITNVGLKTL